MSLIRPSHPEFFTAVHANDVSFLRRYASAITPTLASDLTARCASLGHAQSMEILLPLVQKNTYGDYLFCSVKKGHANCTKLIIPMCNGDDIKKALIMAVKLEHNECLQELVLVADSSMKKSALWVASMYLKRQSLDVLLPVSDNPSDHNEALINFVMAVRADCIDLLIPVSDHQAALKAVTEFCDQERIDFFQNRIAQYEKNIIHNNLSHDNIMRPSKKM